MSRPASRGRSATAMMPTGSPVARDEHRRPPVARQSRRAARGSSGEHSRALLEQPVVAEEHAARRPRGPRRRVRPATHTSVAGAAHDAASPRRSRTMACAIGCSERRSTEAASASDCVGVDAVERHDVDHFWRAARERAGLVERDAADAAGALEVRAAFDQHALARRARQRRHDRDRRGDDERARTGDDEQHQRAVDPDVPVRTEKRAAARPRARAASTITAGV